MIKAMLYSLVHYKSYIPWKPSARHCTIGSLGFSSRVFRKEDISEYTIHHICQCFLYTGRSYVVVV